MRPKSLYAKTRSVGNIFSSEYTSSVGSKRSLEFYSHMYTYIHVYSLNVVQDFRSDSSFYCYRLVSYGQQVTTLIRQHQRMTGKFKCWRLNTDSNSCYGDNYCVTHKNAVYAFTKNL